MTCISKSLNISFDVPATAWHGDAACLAEEQQRASLLLRRSSRSARRARSGRSGASANVSVNSNSAIARPNIVKSIGAAGGDLRETRSETGRGRPGCVQPLEHRLRGSARCGTRCASGGGTAAAQPSSNWSNSGPIGPRRAGEAGRPRPARSAGCGPARSGDASRPDRPAGTSSSLRARGNRNPWRVVERIAGRRGEAAVPHQLRIERRVDHHRRATLVARADCGSARRGCCSGRRSRSTACRRNRSPASGSRRRCCRRAVRRTCRTTAAGRDSPGLG